MTESDQGYPAEAVAEPQGEPEAAPVSAEPETAEAPQAAQEAEETPKEDTPYLAAKPETPETPEPENEFVVRERELRAQGWLPRSERGADYAGPIPLGELAVYPEVAPRPVIQFDPAFDENPVDHPSRLPPACRPCKA